ncbi:MAG: hypothetical protein HFJ12_03450 [Bacilli bacterium]|nr:hypothetical protein [Bacilli bacterium]
MKCEEKEAVFLIKNQLIYGSIVRLLQTYQSEDGYQKFLFNVLSLMEHDKLFLASFPVTIDKILEVINKKRFEFKTTNEIRQQENKIIVSANTIKMILPDEARNCYRLTQEKLRGITIATDEELVDQIAYDIHVIASLRTNNMVYFEPMKFLSSTAYLIETFPEFYQQNPNFIEKSLDYIDVFDKLDVPYDKKNAKVISKKFKKCRNFKKEE